MGALTAKAVLRQNYLFRELPDPVLDQLAGIAVQRAYEKGSVIFLEGDEADALYGVAAGRIRLSAARSDGRELYLKFMEPGDTFGEIAVLDGLPRTAGARAVESSVLVVIRRDPFLDAVHHNREFASQVIRFLCDRLRWTSELLEQASFLDTHARLAKRLTNLASLHGTPTERGVELKITQSDLAQFLSISRQIVNQHLQDWRANGWVDLAPKKVIVCDAEALDRLVDEAVTGSAV